MKVQAHPYIYRSGTRGSMSMEFVEQPCTLKVENHDVSRNELKRHGPLFPDSVRAIIAGASGSGKTNSLISIIEDSNGLKFKNIYIFSKSLHQPKYQYLKNVLEPLRGLGYYAYGKNDDVIPVAEAKPYSLMIFDDVITEKSTSMRDYFCMGRHNKIDSFYLCQTYSKIPKQLIRDNANFIILFKQDLLNLKHVYNDHVGSDMSFDKFKSICGECWKEPYGFITLDLESNINEGRYRKGFDCYIVV